MGKSNLRGLSRIQCRAGLLDTSTDRPNYERYRGLVANPDCIRWCYSLLRRRQHRQRRHWANDIGEPILHHCRAVVPNTYRIGPFKLVYISVWQPNRSYRILVIMRALLLSIILLPLACLAQPGPSPSGGGGGGISSATATNIAAYQAQQATNVLANAISTTGQYGAG